MAALSSRCVPCALHCRTLQGDQPRHAVPRWQGKMPTMRPSPRAAAAAANEQYYSARTLREMQSSQQRIQAGDQSSGRHGLSELARIRVPR